MYYDIKKYVLDFFFLHLVPFSSNGGGKRQERDLFETSAKSPQ